MDNEHNQKVQRARNLRDAMAATEPLKKAAANLLAHSIPKIIIKTGDIVPEYIYDEETQSALAKYHNEVLRIFDSYMRWGLQDGD